MQRNTGLFITHWGGLPFSALSEQNINSCLQSFCLDCNEDDDFFMRSKYWKNLQQEGRGANARSLEHAAMKWLLHGQSESNLNIENWIKGEIIVRFLAAPLLLGTVSSRQV